LEERLIPLQIEAVCNTREAIIIAQIQSAMARELPTVDISTEIQSKPLILFGSGPSAFHYFDELPQIEYDILAMNGSYKALLQRNIVPKYFAMLDARPENVNFLDDIRPETTVFLASQVHPDCYEKLKDHPNLKMFHLNTTACREIVKGTAMFLGSSAGTVGMTSLSIAGLLGYRHLILIGFDSSMEPKTGRSHLLFQPQNADQLCMRVWLEDREYWTTPTLAQQVQDFFGWASALHRSFPGMAIDAFGEGLFYDWIVTNQAAGPATRESEALKYKECYGDDRYGMPTYRRNLIRDVLAVTPGHTLLDVGTGRGETLEEADALGKNPMGTETVDDLLNERVIRALLPELPFPDKSMDIVTCFEVLEHLLPADVEPGIRELVRVAKGHIVVSVCEAPHVVGGVNLHPSAMPREKWEELLRKNTGKEPEYVGNVSTIGVSPAYRIAL
jgi:hypothetical protein